MLSPEINIVIDCRKQAKVKISIGRTKIVESECAGVAAALKEAAYDARRFAEKISEAAKGLEDRAADIESIRSAS